MTIPIDDQRLEAYLPVYDVVPEKWEDARGFITEQLKRISNEVNLREIGWFLDEQAISGKQFIPSLTNPTGEQGQFRTVFRKVINFGPLPNATTKSVAHGLTFDGNFSLVQLYGAGTQPSTLAIPLPYASRTASANCLELYMDTTNVNVATGVNYSAYTISYIVIEYLYEP